MPQLHRGRNFVYILTARPARARKRFFKIDIANAESRHSLCNGIFLHLLVEIDELHAKSATELLRGNEPARAFAGENRVEIGQHLLRPAIFAFCVTA